MRCESVRRPPPLILEKSCRQHTRECSRYVTTIVSINLKSRLTGGHDYIATDSDLENWYFPIPSTIMGQRNISEGLSVGCEVKLLTRLVAAITSRWRAICNGDYGIVHAPGASHGRGSHPPVGSVLSGSHAL